jgi:5-methylcytosine-specific restriction endonuclease McrA
MRQAGILRAGELLPPEEVLPHILDGGENDKRLIELGGYTVNVKSRRLYVFKTKGLKCVNCGIQGQHFAIERFPTSETYHLNLYAVKNGIEILMTRDHVWARGLGGSNSIHNQVTMCALCNRQKSKIESQIANARAAAKLRQEKKDFININGVTHTVVEKELSCLVPTRSEEPSTKTQALAG